MYSLYIPQPYHHEQTSVILAMYRLYISLYRADGKER